MKPIALKMKCAFALAVGGILAAGPVFADKPAWAGAGKSGKDERVERRDEQRGERKDERGERREERRGKSVASDESRKHFEDRHRVVVREYYEGQFQKGRCPPGLAKKHNGCMPPGQAKKWAVGQPLPRNVTYYSVPQPIVVQIGPPPPGYRYVRVSDDILLMETATRRIVDAIQGFGR